MKERALIFAALTAILLYALPGMTANKEAKSNKAPLSSESQACVDCHKGFHSGVVGDWLSSRHAMVTPEQALQKPELERRISSTSIPEKLSKVAVGCYECHSLNEKAHTDNFEHFGYNINVVVTPNDCKTCHKTEVEQYMGSKKASALDNLQKNPVYHALVETIVSTKDVKDNKVVRTAVSEDAKNQTCYACHGTKVTVKGKKKLSTSFGDAEVPELTNWPNQGVGRINPDGSYGACTSCHPRHGFSLKVARKPYTCGECHLEPDIPAYNVYHESKHGNIYSSLNADWNFEAVPWTAGKDFRAPTCATCHNSLLTNADGEVVAQRSHDFGARLWVRIFGLIYSHPQPKSGKTYEIKNKDGLPLPTAFTGETASSFLIDQAEQRKRQDVMQGVCKGCHGTSWTESYFTKFHKIVEEADAMAKASTLLLVSAWGKGLADKSNPFDEPIEQRWVRQWLIYANSVRYSAAMQGPDYAAFKNGYWELTNNLAEMEQFIRLTPKKKK